MDQQTLNRYLDALAQDPKLPGTRQVSVEVLAEGTDQLAEQLGSAWVESPGQFNFSLRNGRLTEFAKVRGNPWDLHEYLRELQRLSARIPLLKFRVYFEDDVTDATLRAGSYRGLPYAYLDAWVARFPRPDLAGLYTRFALRCTVSRVTAKKIRDAVEPELVPLLNAGVRASVLKRPGGIEVLAEVDAPQQFGYGLALIGSVSDALLFSEGRWLCEVSFGGDQNWRCTVKDLVGLRCLELVLWTGLRDVPRRSEEATEPARQIQDLPRLEGIAEAFADEALQLRFDGGPPNVWLWADGSFREGEPLAAFVSPDGRYSATFEPHGSATRVARIDRVSQTTQALVGEDAAYKDSPLGFFNDELILVEVLIAYGRSKYRFVAVPPEGPRRLSSIFINATPYTLDASQGRIIFDTDVDGRGQLWELNLHSFAANVLEVAGGGAEALLTFESQIFGVFSTRQRTTLDRLETGRGFLPFAELEGNFYPRAKVDSDTVYLCTATYSGEETRHDLHAVSLRDGSVHTLTRAIPDDELQGQPRVLVNSGGYVAFVCGESKTVHWFERGEPRGSFKLPTGPLLSDVAISPTGALAITTETDDSYRLHLFRAGVHLERPLPASATRLAWEGRAIPKL